MTTNDARNAIYEKLREIFPGDFIYKQEKPDDAKHSLWIVINTLPSSERTGDQNGPITMDLVVNVNFHVNDLKKGKADFDTLKDYADEFLTYLPLELGSVVAYLGGDNLIRELDKQSHYQNIRLNVILIS
jgi:hypothetical protein